MNATELRIGNLVSYNETEFTVYGISCPHTDNKYLVDLSNDGVITVISDKISPVPIIEEWLLKSGFDKQIIKNYFYKQCGEYEMRVSVNVFSGSIDRDASWFISIQIGYGSQPYSLIKKYVHQLQNLYFTLSGEELNLKSK